MDFAAAWKSLKVGEQATVSNGEPPPSNVDGTPYKVWASHNFTGTLVKKKGGKYRAMHFDLPPNKHGNVIGYTVQEGAGHSFASET